MERTGRDRLFIGALKLLAYPETIRWSSHDHTNSRVGLATMEKLGIAYRSSFKGVEKQVLPFSCLTCKDRRNSGMEGNKGLMPLPLAP